MARRRRRTSRSTSPDQPVPLITRFKAIVDGTNGDTWLDRVEARLGRIGHRRVGAVVRERDVKGRHVALDIQIREARLEDVHAAGGQGRQAADDRPHRPDDDVPASRRRTGRDRSAELNGQFSLAQARFTTSTCSGASTALSLRARGDENAEPTRDGSSVVSNLRGRFVDARAKLDFKQLTFAIPGRRGAADWRYDCAAEHWTSRANCCWSEPRGHDERLQVLPRPTGAAVLPTARWRLEAADQDLRTANEA